MYSTCFRPKQAGMSIFVWKTEPGILLGTPHWSKYECDILVIM